jgi:hypothetical protein
VSTLSDSRSSWRVGLDEGKGRVLCWSLIRSHEAKEVGVGCSGELSEEAMEESKQDGREAPLYTCEEELVAASRDARKR